MNTYPAISPLRPELSQAGKTILITGRATGIRLTAAEGFALAGVKRIILVARSADVIESAVAKLKFSPHCKAEVIGRPCDISDIAAIDEFWSGLEQAKIIVDLLVLSVVRLTREVTIVELSYEEVWNAFNTNVRGNLILAEEFLKHIDVFPNGKKKALLNVSTMSVHDFNINANRPTYSATKNSSTLLTQLTAAETPVEKVQIISYHLHWACAKLPGHFVVSAASPEAAFLHGQSLWAGWDVEKLMKGEIRDRIDSNPDYLKIGVVGLA